jgi:hypothetical protein
MNIHLDASRVRRKMANVLVIHASQSEVAGVEGVSGLGDKTHRRVGEITDRIGGSQQRAMKMAIVVASRTLIA